MQTRSYLHALFQAGRGVAAAATRIFRGYSVEAGCGAADVDIPRRRVAAPPTWIFRGGGRYSQEKESSAQTAGRVAVLRHHGVLHELEGDWACAVTGRSIFRSAPAPRGAQRTVGSRTLTGQIMSSGISRRPIRRRLRRRRWSRSCLSRRRWCSAAPSTTCCRLTFRARRAACTCARASTILSAFASAASADSSAGQLVCRPLEGHGKISSNGIRSARRRQNVERRPRGHADAPEVARRDRLQRRVVDVVPARAGGNDVSTRVWATTRGRGSSEGAASGSRPRGEERRRRLRAPRRAGSRAATPRRRRG